VLDEIRSRLRYLTEVGLEYLTLDRQSRTLSGGELERVDLTTAIGSSLVNTLYVLDEPSIGLHPRDTERLVRVLHRLRDQGNAVCVVEHDPAIIRAADHIIDLGPGAGERGGSIVFAGPPVALGGARGSLTADYLCGRRSIPMPRRRRKPLKNLVLRIRGASAHNLQHVDVEVPLGCFVAVTGVSGSGKSTLVDEVLYRGLRKLRGEPVGIPGACAAIEGAERIAQVVLVDQAPIGSTPRANAATYLRAFDGIRACFAKTEDARLRGFSAVTFSFNVAGGRCETCTGEGFEKVEMQFLSDVYVPCAECGGTRYRPEVLEVRWRGRSIRDVLELTVAEAMELFSDVPDVVDRLRPLADVGLDYLRLGQPLSTLSGGEAQRVKLASQLGREGKAHTLFIFDEPTTGLHLADVDRLLASFARLVERGHSLLVIEHNLEVVKCADWVIDLGPEGGDGGGRVVAAGPPEAIAATPASHTGRFLREVLAPREPLVADAAPPLARALPPGSDRLRIAGAREHNLKDVSLELPRDRLIVMTGLSGSGKSSLAFDVLHAEGQRRYLDSLSTYARQFLPILAKPDVDVLAGLPPTVAIEQRLSRGGRTSTVATVTEIYHYLRLLFAKLGVQHCPGCDTAITAQSESQIVDRLRADFRRTRVTLLAPVVRGRKGFHRETLLAARKLRLREARIDGKWVDLKTIPALDRYREHDVDLVVATLRPDDAALEAAALRALRLGTGTLVARAGEAERVYSARLFCAACGTGFEPLEPRLFSFNSRQGACPACDGVGSTPSFEPDAVLDPARTLGDGAILPLETADLRGEKRRLLRALAQAGVPLDRAVGRLSARQRALLLEGRPGVPGTLATLARLLREGTAPQLDEFTTERACADCGGERLNARARHVRVQGHTISALTALAVTDAERAVGALRFAAREAAIAEGAIKEILPRLRFLDRVGLGYLALDRRADTLSGGEGQRIRLAAQLGSNLRGVCYVLDEPTIGLHPRDNAMLLDTLEALRARGNTVLVVEHDEATILRADLVVDLGPGAGTHGGQVVAVAPAGRARRQSGVGDGSLPRREPPAPRSRPSARCRSPPRRPGRGRAQPPERRRAFPARRLDVRDGGLGLRQVDARPRRPLPRDAACARAGHRSRRGAPQARGGRASRAGVRGRPEPHRPHAALHAGLVRRRVRRHPAALRAGARGPAPGLRRRPFLLQRRGRALRRLRRPGPPAHGDELPSRRLRRLRHVRGPALHGRDARHPLGGAHDRRRAQHDDRGGRDVLRATPAGLALPRGPERHRAWLSDARPAEQYALGGRGAANQARLRARQGVPRPDAVRARRAHHRAPFRRHRPADRRPPPPRRPRQHRGDHRAQSGHRERGRLGRRPRPRGRRGGRADRGRGPTTGRRRDARVTHGPLAPGAADVVRGLRAARQLAAGSRPSRTRSLVGSRTTSTARSRAARTPSSITVAASPCVPRRSAGPGITTPSSSRMRTR
jgi:excinuclease ABC subunit A